MLIATFPCEPVLHLCILPILHVHPEYIDLMQWRNPAELSQNAPRHAPKRVLTHIAAVCAGAASSSEPLCFLCKHPHNDGEKCSKCGHIGHVAGPKIVRSRGPSNSALHFVAGDVSDPSMPGPKFKEHLLLAGILRKMVFVEELLQAEPLYEVTEADYNFRHVFAQRTLRSSVFMDDTSLSCDISGPLIRYL